MAVMIPPPAQAVLAAGAIWLADWAVPGLRLDVPGRGALAIVLAALGAGIGAVSVAAFIRARTTISPLAPHKTERLVITGLYRFSRNPMYLGLALLLAAWTVWLANPLGALVVAAFIAAITRLQIKPEENALSAKFGAAYDAYCARVRRWI